MSFSLIHFFPSQQFHSVYKRETGVEQPNIIDIEPNKFKVDVSDERKKKRKKEERNKDTNKDGRKETRFSLSIYDVREVSRRDEKLDTEDNKHPSQSASIKTIAVSAHSTPGMPPQTSHAGTSPLAGQ